MRRKARARAPRKNGCAHERSSSSCICEMSPVWNQPPAHASAVASVRWMVGWLNTRGLGVFGVWRLLGAALVAGMLWTGRM